MSHHTPSRRMALGAVAASALLLVTACSSTATSDEPAAEGTASDSCGVLGTVAPQDPDGAVAALTDESQALYNGYPYEVLASDWADWAPDHEGPYTVGIAFATLQNSYQTALLEAIEDALNGHSEISDVITTTATSNDVSAQIQQYNALVQQGVDLIIYQPNGTDAFVPVVEEAAAQGIPSISVQNSVPSSASVNVTTNTYLWATTAADELIEHIGGEGNILGVHGVAGSSGDTTTFDAFTAAFAQCPDIEIVGELTGNYDSSVAKSEVLQFLSSSTGEIDGVFQSAVMAPGIISAFVESGLDVPTVIDFPAQQASLAYWRDNVDTYDGIAIGQSPVATGRLVGELAGRMLAGGGITVSDVVVDVPFITEDTLGDWVDDAWDLTSVGTAVGPDDLTVASDAYLDDIFTNDN